MRYVRRLKSIRKVLISYTVERLMSDTNAAKDFAAHSGNTNGFSLNKLSLGLQTAKAGTDICATNSGLTLWISSWWVVAIEVRPSAGAR